MTPEQKQQLEQVREQQAAHSALFDAHDSHKIVQRSEIRTMLNSIDFLLSLVKSQEASTGIADDLPYRIVESMGLGLTFRSCSCGQLPCARLQPLRNALETVATSMRSACVEKVVATPAKNIVRTTTEEVRGAASFKSDVLRELESLSIEQPKE